MSKDWAMVIRMLIYGLLSMGWAHLGYRLIAAGYEVVGTLAFIPAVYVIYRMFKDDPEAA